MKIFFFKNKNNNYIKNIIINKLFKIIILQVLIIFFLFIKINKIYYNQDISKNQNNKYNYKSKINLNFENNKFAIIQYKCGICGLLSIYFFYLGCVNIYINKGYIPIIDHATFPNIFNKFNISSLKNNPWEFFFNQPFNYSLKYIIKKAKNIQYFKCKNIYKTFPDHSIYDNLVLLDYYHYISEKYIPIKNEVIKEAIYIRKKLFNNYNNILGILARGTDYISKRPKYHPIPPNNELFIHDIKEMDKKNNYDLFFMTTEDDIIRQKFINEFGKKLKYIKYNKKINYNYINKNYISFNENIIGNIEYSKIYLINIIILSKSTDIICARTGGAIGTFILTNGFRNSKVYNLGVY